MSTSGTCIIIAAYNEGRIISQTLQAFNDLTYVVVVVDDGSTDDTVQQALNYSVTILCHAVNLGQGAAIQTGIEFALQLPNIDKIVTFDADGQHNVDEIPLLIAPLSQDYDIVLGSRFLNAHGASQIPRARKWLLRLAVLFTRWTTGLKITDTHNGLRAFNLKAARGLGITQNRMAHASEILTFISKSKLRYCEVPTTIRYTDYSLQKGQSIWNSINILWEIISEKMR